MHGYNLDDVSKIATPDHLKTKTFQNKAYDVIIIDYDVIDNIILRYSN